MTIQCEVVEPNPLTRSIGNSSLDKLSTFDTSSLEARSKSSTCCESCERELQDYDDEDESSEFGDEPSGGGITCRQAVSLFLLLMSGLTSATAVSLFPPFYPQVAEEKHTTASIYGVVLGSNDLTMFLLTPFVGNHLRTIGLKFAFVSGMFINGVCSALSGSLSAMPAGWVFVFFSITIRVVHAVGNAFVITSSFTIMAVEFPHSVAKVFGLTRVILNAGQLTGPAIGGALYEIGGFPFPFIVLGVVQCLVSFVSLFAQPTYEDDLDSKEQSNKSHQSASVSDLMRIKTIWLSFSSFIISTITNGFLSVTLEPQVLRQFAMSPFYMGMLFGVKDGANSLSSPFWGWLSDYKRLVKLCLIVSTAMTAASFVCLGPLPMLPIVQTFNVVIIGLLLNGAAVGGQQVSGVVDALNEAIDAGYPDDPNTHGIVAGLWTSFSGLGRFVARTGSGILVDYIGYKESSVVIFALNSILVVVAAIFVCMNSPCAEKKSLSSLLHVSIISNKAYSKEEVQELLTSAEKGKTYNSAQLAGRYK